MRRPFPPAICVALAALAAALAAGPARAQQPAANAAPSCGAPADVVRLDHPLPRTAARIKAGLPLKIVAIGSSSTAGAGASSPAASYPSRLAIELAALLPKHDIAVVNRGVNGEEARDMIARFEDSVISEKPDLVIWQVGTNAVLRDHPLAPAETLMHEGLRRLKTSGADVILMDPQFAPKVLAKVDVDEMVELIGATAKQENVNLFHRFAAMRHWRQVQNIPFDILLSPDELHMNDWSYGCLGKLLAGSIAEAATRATLTASAGAPQR